MTSPALDDFYSVMDGATIEFQGAREGDRRSRHMPTAEEAVWPARVVVFRPFVDDDLCLLRPVEDLAIVDPSRGRALNLSTLR